MKKLPLVLSLLLGTLQLHAQNWRPLHPGYVYQYDDPTGKYYSQNCGLNHLKVVSKISDGSDSVYYLNTAAVKFKPSADYINNYFSKLHLSVLPNAISLYGLLIDNQAFFLNKKVRISGSDWIFEGDNAFVLKPAAAKGDTWTFSQSQSITAEVTDIQTGTVLGVTDDIKTITLSTGDVIKLSKNHGIISFPAFDGNNNLHTLKGVEGPDVGIIVPKSKEIYDFQPGDMFQYENRRYGSLGNEGEYISQVIIQNRTETDTSFIYRIREIKLKDGKASLSTRTEEYEFAGTHPMNLYPGEISGISAKHEGWDYAYESNLGRSGRQFQSGEYVYWERINQNHDTLYPLGYMDIPDVKMEYYTGIGLTYDHIYGMMGESKTVLTAFRKMDGSKMGTMLTIDTTTSIGDLAHSSLRLQVYPNPADGETITVSGHMSRPGALQLTMTDLQGRAILTNPVIELPAGDLNQPLNIGQVSPGVYLLRVNGAGVREVMKVSVVK